MPVGMNGDRVERMQAPKPVALRKPVPRRFRAESGDGWADEPPLTLISKPGRDAQLVDGEGKSCVLGRVAVRCILPKNRVGLIPELKDGSPVGTHNASDPVAGHGGDRKSCKRGYARGRSRRIFAPVGHAFRIEAGVSVIQNKVSAQPVRGEVAQEPVSFEEEKVFFVRGNQLQRTLTCTQTNRAK